MLTHITNCHPNDEHLLELVSEQTHCMDLALDNCYGSLSTVKCLKEVHVSCGTFKFRQNGVSFIVI